MSPEKIAARLALREALRNHNETRIQVARAARVVRMLIEPSNKTPALIRRQVG